MNMIETTAEYQDTIRGGWANSPLTEINIGKKLKDIFPNKGLIGEAFSAPDFYGNDEEEEEAGINSLIETGIFMGFIYKESRIGMGSSEWIDLLAEVKILCEKWK
jgi:hypothetical protein